ncbi:HHR239Wp [Eremothecium sinecaudum]|uniref:HHR239Wp n=1 Tax=Eremothecium sinecaudum TaxID=45286 RepID=A0A109V0S2_9SACH|nr:HHR239Wp [Eremothecium sinecaudum]AMD23008.1 HHR239Wp [Eremothecium sinecaudum]
MSQASDMNPSISVDYSKVAAYLQLDDEKIKGFDESLVKIFEQKAHAFEQLKAENMRLSITIDSVKSSSEKKIGSFKKQVEKLLADAEARQQENSKEEDMRLKLIEEKGRLSQEIVLLRSKVEEQKQQRELAEMAKQDITKLLEEKISDLQATKSEVDKLLSTNKESRKQLMELELASQNLKSQALRDSSKIERLEQELNMTKSNNEWLSSQLEARSTELNEYRGKTNAELQSCHSQLNFVSNDLDIARSNNNMLKKKTTELSNQLTEKLEEVKRLTDLRNTEKEEFTKEMSLKQRLIDLLEGQVDSMKADLEKAYSIDHGTSFPQSEKDRILDELFDTKKRLESSQAKVAKLEKTVNELLSINDNIASADLMSETSSISYQNQSHKLHGEIGLLKKQSIKERRQKEELEHQVEAFVVELEHKIPVLNSFKERTELLEKELNDVTLLLESTAQERDQRTAELKQYKSKISSYEEQVCSLIRQRSDLAHQVQYLLINISVTEDSRGPLSSKEVEFIRKIIASEDDAAESDTQTVISERLVEFQSVIELQQKNVELLNTIRQLADKVEEEERKSRSSSKAVDQETIKEAKEAILSLQEHTQNLEDQLSILAKERDALKLLVAGHRNGKERSELLPKEQLDEAKKRIVELEDHLKTVSEESSKNMKLLNEEIMNLYKSKSQASLSMEKERSSRILAEERLKLLHTTLDLTRSENDELKKRAEKLQSIVLEQDAKTQSTIEEIVLTKSRVSELISQLSIVQSERDLLRKIESELKNENENLSKQKSESLILISQLQTLQNERDTLLDETQRSYREKFERVEADLRNAREQLDKKSRELEDQRSTESAQFKWFQTKVDSLNEELDSTRRSLQEKVISVETLQIQISNLTAKLEETQLRAQSYSVLTNSDGASEQIESLRKNLEKANINLSDAYSQIEHYKCLSKASEESASEISKVLEESHENFRKRISDFEDETNKMRDHISMLTEEVKNLNNELDYQKSQHEKEKSDLANKLSILEGSQQSVDTLKSEYEQKIAKLQEDLNEQAQYANKAISNYEQELQKHADVTKTISLLREECQKYRAEMEKFRQSARDAHNALERGDREWSQQKTELEKQYSSLQQRVEELTTQNRLLYDQIELLSRSKESASSNSEDISYDARELLVTLRRERDILATKLDVSLREEKILRQRLELTKSELEAVRVELSKTQSLSNDTAITLENQEQIMEKLNQLNLLRESNVTLRNESKRYVEENHKLKEQISELQERLQPLESELRSSSMKITEKTQQIDLLKEEIGRWKQRSEDIIHKYERVDPEEYRKLLDKVTELKAELEKKSSEYNESQERFKKLRKQANERLVELKNAKQAVETELELNTEAKAKLEAQVSDAQSKIAKLEQQLNAKPEGLDIHTENLKKELEETRAKLAEAEETVSSLNSAIAASESSFRVQIDELSEKIKLLEKNEATSSAENNSDQDMPANVAVIIGNLKAEFEQERQALLEQNEKILNERLEAQRKEILEEYEKSKKDLEAAKGTSQSTPSLDEEALRKQLEAELESETLQRIHEAEEALKKRIRLPSEERINHVIERRQKALEEEFEAKVNARANELFKENPESFIGNTAELIKSHKDEIQKLKDELKAEFEEQANQIRRKALEEGKQQLSMKVRLLESKIAKLEGQAKSSNSNVPAKIPMNKNDNALPSATPIALLPSPFQVAFGQANFGNTSFGSLVKKSEEVKEVNPTAPNIKIENENMPTNKRQFEEENSESSEKRLKEE